MKARVRVANMLIMLVLFSAILIACGGGGGGGSGGKNILSGWVTLETNVTVLSNIGNNDPIMGASACAYEDDTCQDFIFTYCCTTDSDGECTMRKTSVGEGQSLNIYLSVSADGYQNECQASKMNEKGYDHTVYLNPSS